MISVQIVFDIHFTSFTIKNTRIGSRPKQLLRQEGGADATGSDCDIRIAIHQHILNQVSVTLPELQS